MIAVSDASGLIALARIGRLDLLRQLVARVGIPEAVYREAGEAGLGRPGSGEISGAAWDLRGHREPCDRDRGQRVPGTYAETFELLVEGAFWIRSNGTPRAKWSGPGT